MMRQLTRRLLKDPRGVTSVEYGLIVLLVVIGIVGFVGQIGQNTCRPFSQAANAFTSP